MKDGTLRWLCGAGYYNAEISARLSVRKANRPQTLSPDIGFRLAFSVAEAEAGPRFLELTAQ